MIFPKNANIKDVKAVQHTLDNFGQAIAEVMRSGVVYLIDAAGKVIVRTTEEYAALPDEVADVYVVRLTFGSALATAQRIRGARRCWS